MNLKRIINPGNLIPSIATITLSSVLVLSGCGETPEDVSGAAEAHIQQGYANIQRGQFRTALIDAKNAIQNLPDDERGYILIASIYNKLGNGKQAIIELEKIEGTSNTYFKALAESYQQRGKYRSALDTLNSHAEIEANSPLEYNHIAAKAYRGLKQAEEAINAYNKILELQPTDTEALLGLIRYDILNNRPAEADKKLAIIEEDSQGDSRVFLIKAQIASRNNDVEKTEYWLTQAISSLPNTDIITPQKSSVLKALADVLARQGRSAEALIYTRLLSEARPGTESLMNKYTDAIELAKENKLDEAEALLESILETAPGHGPSEQMLGVINYLQGDIQVAEQYFNENFDAELASAGTKHIFALTNMKLNQPKKVLALLKDDIDITANVQVLSLYGVAAFADGDTKKGEEALLKALKIDPTKTRLHLMLAQHYNNKRPPELPRALEQLQKAFAQTPSDPFIQSALVQQYIKQGQQSKASEIVNTISKKFAEDSNSLVVVGNYYYSLKQLDKAKKALQSALIADSNNSYAILSLGKVLIADKDFEGSKSKFRKLIKLQPESPIGYKDMMSSYEVMGQASAGLKELNSLAENSDNVMPRLVLAEYHIRKRDFNSASKHIELAEAKSENDERIRKLKAMNALAEARTLIEKESIDQARNVILKGLNSDSGNIQLLGMLLHIETLSQNYSEAQKVIDQIKDDTPDLALYLQGDLALAQSELAEALVSYKKVWAMKSSDALGNKIYRLHRSLNQTEDASTFLSDWAQQIPNGFNMLSVTSQEAIASENYDKAIEALQTVIKQSSKPNSALLNNLAWAYLETGNNSEALKYSNLAYQASPTNASIIDTYGWVLYKQGNINKARELLAKALELRPTDTEIQAHWKQVGAE